MWFSCHAHLRIRAELTAAPPPPQPLTGKGWSRKHGDTSLARDYTGFMLALGCRDGCLEPRDSRLKF